jgi:hypothetical protein
MADITITAASVLASTTAKNNRGVAGQAITAGQVVYLDGTDNRYKLAIATSKPTAEALGIATNNAAAGQPLIVAEFDENLSIGGTVVVGTVYVLSAAAAGAIAPVADLAAGNFVTLLGVAKTAGTIKLLVTRSGIAKP